MMKNINDKWIPKKKELYYTIGFDGSVVSKERTTETDRYFTFIKYFKTKKELDEFLEIHKIFAKNSFQPDWDNPNQDKWMLCSYNTRQHRVTCCVSTYRQEATKYYFKDEEQLKKLIKRFGSEKIAKYILELQV